MITGAATALNRNHQRRRDTLCLGLGIPQERVEPVLTMIPAQKLVG